MGVSQSMNVYVRGVVRGMFRDSELVSECEETLVDLEVFYLGHLKNFYTIQYNTKKNL